MVLCALQVPLRLLLDVFIRKGVERTLAFCGWMVACHFNSVFDPVQAQVIFFRKPRAPAVTEDFLRAFLRSALVCIGLPRPVYASEGSIRTKIKLWGVVIFHDMYPRDLQLQDILDVWDQVSSFLDDPKDIRLVSQHG